MVFIPQQHWFSKKQDPPGMLDREAVMEAVMGVAVATMCGGSPVSMVINTNMAIFVRSACYEEYVSLDMGDLNESYTLLIKRGNPRPV